MNLLLDTNILLWWFADSPRLNDATREKICASHLVYVSAATTWEIEIKRALGKLKAPSDLEQALSASHFEPLAITIGHSISAAMLPRHHDDPFDRMLIAQASVEGLTLLTADKWLEEYDGDIELI